MILSIRIIPALRGPRRSRATWSSDVVEATEPPSAPARGDIRRQPDNRNSISFAPLIPSSENVSNAQQHSRSAGAEEKSDGRGVSKIRAETRGDREDTEADSQAANPPCKSGGCAREA